MTTELMYYVHYLSGLFSRPTDEIILSITQLVGQYVLMYNLYHSGYSHEVFYGWFLPGKFAIFFLAFAFDYLPHRPPPGVSNPVLRTESEYTATSVTSLFGFTDYSLLSYVLLYQNFHNIHHLVPYVPFYCYAPLWYRYEKELKDKGTVINPMLNLSGRIAEKSN